MIVAAAMRHRTTGEIVSLPAPARHGDLFLPAIEKWGSAHHEQGFIDANEGFVSRERAIYIVMVERQPLRDGKREPDHARELFSEDLW